MVECTLTGLVASIDFFGIVGRQSIWFGIDGQRPDVWEFGGKALAGFSGTTGQYLNGVQVSLNYPGTYVLMRLMLSTGTVE